MLYVVGFDVAWCGILCCMLWESILHGVGVDVAWCWI